MHGRFPIEVSVMRKQTRRAVLTCTAKLGSLCPFARFHKLKGRETEDCLFVISGTAASDTYKSQQLLFY